MVGGIGIRVSLDEFQRVRVVVRTVVVRRSSQFPWNGKISAIAPLDAPIPESGMQLKETSIDRIVCPKTIFVSDEISRESTVTAFSVRTMRRWTRKFASLREHWPSSAFLSFSVSSFFCLRSFLFYALRFLLRTDSFGPLSNVYRRQTWNSSFPGQVVSALFRSRGSTFPFRCFFLFFPEPAAFQFFSLRERENHARS